MENKYFTPDIEDIHVGYACEELRNGNWEFLNIPYNECLDDLYNQCLNNFIRVPYLTKEDIEDEGWERYHMDGTYIKDNYILNFDFATGLNRLNIHKKPETGKNVTSHDMLFNSKCKCINDFRKIIKLLGI